MENQRKNRFFFLIYLLTCHYVISLSKNIAIFLNCQENSREEVVLSSSSQKSDIKIEKKTSDVERRRRGSAASNLI